MELLVNHATPLHSYIITVCFLIMSMCNRRVWFSSP